MELNRDKQIDEMAKVIKSSLDGLGSGNFNFTGYEISTMYAKALYNAGYRKAPEVALEAVDYFQSRLRNIFCTMCNDNDYNTVCLLEIDSAIECFFEAFVAELKKKYTEGGE